MNTQHDKTTYGDFSKVSKTTQSQNGLVESQNLPTKPQNTKLRDSSMPLKELMAHAVERPEASTQECGSEKLKRHWTEVAGRVFIPERWDHEAFLRDWIDYSSFDALLAPKGVDSARKALVAEGRRTSSRCRGKGVGVHSFT